MQYNLSTTAPQDLWTESSSISRVELTYKTGASSGCSSVTRTSITVNVGPPSAGSITGIAAVCRGQSGVAYSVNIPGATNCVWYYSGTGATINGTGSSITIDFASNATAGNLTVYGTNSCGTGSVSSPFAISIPNYTITASTGTNGSVTPTGATVMVCGNSQSYNITANSGYHVADVLVDGISQGAISTYTFTNVQANHTISATFALSALTITANAGSNGSISPSGSVLVTPGNNQTFNFTPDPCYQIADVVVDGGSVGTPSSYTFTNVQANHTLSVSFARITYTITASAGSNGSITPGTTSVDCGSNQTFTITPGSSCYHIADVLVDGSSVGTVTSYTFVNVTATHTISASFAMNTSAITATTGSYGNISPLGTTMVNCGGSQVYDITPSFCYRVSDVVVDGSSVGAVTSYTFSNITATHTISATFAINTYTITATAGSWGSISPSGPTTVNCGSDQTFTIAPNNCYQVLDVLVDGSSAGALTSYTFNNVTAAHTISASFLVAPAVIICPANMDVNTEGGACQATGVSIGLPDISGSCTGSTVTNDHPSTTYPKGITPVKCTVTTPAGSTATCTQTVTVSDREIPVISCPGDITVNVTPGTCAQTLTYAAPSFTDNCPGTTIALISGLPSGSTFSRGINTLTYQAKDAAGNTSASCSFLITVKDNEPPIPDAFILPDVSGECSANITVTPTATDVCAGSITGTTPDPLSYSAQGTYTVTWKFSDGNGNTAIQTQTVIVQDVTPPVINCPSDISVSVTPGACGGVITYAAPTGTDNCAGAITARIAGPSSGATFLVGVTTITYKVTDAGGNMASCSFTVTVILQNRTLNLKVFLEGLYAGGGKMHPCMDYDINYNYVPKWGIDIADTACIELHDASNYNNIIYTAKNVPLNINGSASVIIPTIHGGDYYVTVKHRNHLETTTAAPVSFSDCIISYDFSTNVNKAYGDNMKNIGGVAAIYSGDITSVGHAYPGRPVPDGGIDLADVYYVFYSYLNGDYGYKFQADINGDGTVDLADIFLAYYNFYLLDIYVSLP
jgi:hypothetical protein